MRPQTLLIVCLLLIAMPLALLSNIDNKPSPNRKNRQLIPYSRMMITLVSYDYEGPPPYPGRNLAYFYIFDSARPPKFQVANMYGDNLRPFNMFFGKDGINGIEVEFIGSYCIVVDSRIDNIWFTRKPLVRNRSIELLLIKAWYSDRFR